MSCFMLPRYKVSNIKSRSPPQFNVRFKTVHNKITNKTGSSDDAGKKTRAESLFPLETFLIENKTLTRCCCIIPKKMHLIKKVLENIIINFILEIKSKTWKPI